MHRFRDKDPFFNYVARYFYSIRHNEIDSLPLHHFTLLRQWVFLPHRGIHAVKRFNTFGALRMAFKDWKFATVSIRREELPEVEKLAETYENDLTLALDVLADDNVKVSMNYVDKRNSWCVTLTPTENNKHNSEISMTSWSKNPIEALWIGIYKHIVICNRKEYPYDTDESAFG